MEALGKHILVEYYNCDKEKLDDVTLIEESMVKAAREAGATVINSTSHHFSPWGVSCVVVIQESHLSIHTWPEYRFASVDLYTCGDSVDPWVGFDCLSKALGSSNFSAVELKRGLRQLLPSQPNYSNLDPNAKNDQTPTVPKVNRNTWFQELDKNVGAGVSVKTVKRLFKENSQFQCVEIYQTEKWGNMLVLDGVVNTTERDEFVYHEMISHVPLLTHPNPKRVLIIGGGDGGTAREVLRHTQLEKVVMVEIDQVVIDAAKKYLPTMARGLSDPKLELIVDDGIKYVLDASDKSFDIIIVDSTDPAGPGEVLFTDEFYQNCIRVLSEDGLLVCQAQSFSGAPDRFQDCYARYDKLFGKENVWAYMYNTPTYPTGCWTFSFCTKGKAHPYKGLDADKIKKFTKGNVCKYYNEAIHKGAFAIPNYVKEMMGRDLN
jgi:spermidine synthase